MLLLGGMFLGLSAYRTWGPTPYTLDLPENWPTPSYPFQQNPLTKEGILLGRRLFYDPILSRDSSTSCSSCHLSYSAFTHIDHPLSHGIEDRIGTRNSIALMNLAWNKHFMWDGGIHLLDAQALAPITDSTELGESLPHVIHKLARNPAYPALFEAAFGTGAITGEHLLKALSQFQLTLISANSKYDQVMRQEEGVAFTPQEAKGYALFQQHCNHCHTEPLFTNHGFAHNGLPIDSLLQDVGRMRITGNSQDSLVFKIPSLRNLSYSFPYMHDGRFQQLSEVLQHYRTEFPPTPTIHPSLKGGIPLDTYQQADLIAFLHTLDDRTFVFNPAFAYPR